MYAEIVGPEDAPDLVLLHGGIGTGRYHWSRQVEALSQRFRVHLADLPGHGRTPLPEDGSYTRGVLVDALAAYLATLAGPAHVGGFSMGGNTALALAQDAPQQFASLALVGVTVREHSGLREWRERFVPERFEHDYPMWARHLARLHEPLGGPDAWREVLRRDSAGDLGVDVDLERLTALTVPVLLIRGDRDAVVDPAQYAALRATWPQADELVVPAGGHDVQLTRHELVRPALSDFYDRVFADR